MLSSQLIKTVLVTGANKGIGFGIIQGLLQKSDKYNIILTARSEERGKESLNKLIEEFSNKKDKIFYHQLDITDKESISNCISWLKGEFGQIDILVNNAAAATKGSNFDINVYNFTFPTNVYGTIDFTEKMLSEDVIRKNGKIILIGSNAGKLSYLSSEDLKNEFKDENLTVEGLLNFAERYKKSILENKVKENGWPEWAYGVSKMIINTYGRVLGSRKDVVERNIGAYSVHPGWVRTDMAGEKAPLTIAEGAETPIYVIELEDGIIPEFQGKYFDKCKPASYYD